VATVINVPVYVRTLLSVRIAIVVPSPTEDGQGISTSLLLGVAGGSAALLAMLLAMVVFMVRQRSKSANEMSSDYHGLEGGGQMTMTMPDDGGTIAMLENPKSEERSATGGRRSTITRERRRSVSDEPLSTDDDNPGEDGGLYI
jgi:hypothetical protein